MEKEVDKKGIIKALVLALLLAFLGIGILGWQYRNIEKEQIPALEEKIEQKSAESLLEKFMHARIEQNEPMAMGYLTERAVADLNEGKFSLLNKMVRYEILDSEKLSENQYRYVVKIYERDGSNDFIEIVTLVKILGQYYIDSLVLGG